MRKLMNFVNQKNGIGYGDSKMINRCEFYITTEEDFRGLCDANKCGECSLELDKDYPECDIYKNNIEKEE